MATAEFIKAVFERAQAAAIAAAEGRKYQEVRLTLEIRGGEAFEAIMPDGERIRPNRIKGNP
jgi:hypothetical protein